MPDYGLYKNAEGYADPTAAEAIKGRAKPGEIYKYKERLVLILKNQGEYSNILTLFGAYRKDKTIIQVAKWYTTPGKISYALNEQLGARVERITEAELQTVLDEIERLLFGKRTPKTPDKKQTEAMAEAAVCTALEAENTALKKRYSVLRSMYDELLDKFIDRFGGDAEDGK